MRNEIKDSPIDHSFDQFLSTHLQASQPYLDDEGFSLNVMQSLPQPKRLSPWVARTILVAPILILFIVLLWVMGFTGVLALVYKAGVILGTVSPLQLAVSASLVLLVGALTWFLSLLKAI